MPYKWIYTLSLNVYSLVNTIKCMKGYAVNQQPCDFFFWTLNRVNVFHEFGVFTLTLKLFIRINTMKMAVIKYENLFHANQSKCRKVFFFLWFIEHVATGIRWTWNENWRVFIQKFHYCPILLLSFVELRCDENRFRSSNIEPCDLNRTLYAS